MYKLFDRLHIAFSLLWYNVTQWIVNFTIFGMAGGRQQKAARLEATGEVLVLTRRFKVPLIGCENLLIRARLATENNRCM